MRINRVALFNFGPYEDINEFNIQEQSETGNIVLIGGKNGAGKTTLFTAIRLCIYGYREGGYQSANSYYKKKVKKLVNDKEKREDIAKSYVEVEFSIVRGTDTDSYRIRRSWTINNADVSEDAQIYRNNELLFGDEINDFENYLLNVLPPELFDLYFFDGERISDFFMEEGGNSRIKNAFLILCGYDNFDIMLRNFKRIGIVNKSDETVIQRYSEAKQRFQQAKRLFDKVNAEIEEKKQEISSIKSEIEELERRYRDKGGVTMDEWNDNFLKLKQEEQYREVRNDWIKKAANEIIPFLIAQKTLKKLEEQLSTEENRYERESLERICVDIINQAIGRLSDRNNISMGSFNGLVEEVKDIIQETDQEEMVLGLSIEEKKILSGQLYTLLQLDKESVIRNRAEVKESIERSKKIRDIIENSSVGTVQEYFSQKEELLKKQAKLTDSLNDLIQYTKDIEIDLELQREMFKRESRILEDELKKDSLSDMTAKAILLLEKLQDKLFTVEVAKVESYFMEKIRELARKSNFIDAIKIDDDFNVHIFKNVTIKTGELYQQVDRYDETSYVKEFGEYHWKYLLERFKASNKLELMKKLKSAKGELEVLYEIDKAVLSNGEKQVYIMTLYWSIMKLCKQEVPFIIDTPFARIDSEHRANITEKFFNDLLGQVFIFSTNEEIVGTHLEILQNNIQAKFLLENVSNDKTTVYRKTYFGG